MKIYLLMQGERGKPESRATAYFFKRSAIAAARRIQAEDGKWQAVTDHETKATEFWITSALWMSIVPLFLLFREWSLKRWVLRRLHWQNLNEDESGNVKGSILKYGRLWLHRASNPEAPDKYRRSQIEFLWHFGGGMRWLGVGVRLFDGESYRDIGLRFGLWFASFYLSLENILPDRFGYPRHSWSHDTSIVIMADGALSGPHVSVDLHHAGGDCFDCKGWKGPHWYWWPLDTLLGEPVYKSEALTEQPVSRRLLMPEAAYPVDITLTRDSWKRPRWPWPSIVHRARIECGKGVPKPGKGENSWDCGDDAIFSMACPAATVEEAMEKLKASVARDRERYGGKSWKPDVSIAR